MRRAVLIGEHVHARLRKVRQTPRVVRVQVGEQDVLHVIAREPEIAQLVVSRLLQGKAREQTQSVCWAEPLQRASDVMRAETGVHEHQAGLGFQKQAVADQLGRLEPAPSAAEDTPASRTKRCAIEVMNFHDPSSTEKPQRTGAASRAEYTSASGELA
jgi:hypothetical protein